MPDLIRSVELKLTRAEEQVRDLTASISDWTAHNPLAVDMVLRDGHLGFRLVLRDFATPAPLDRWSLVTGECVHNLRSALDNLAYALARLRCDPPARQGNVSFPIFQSKADFDKKIRRNLDQLPDEAAQLIEQFQPFQKDESASFGVADFDALVPLQWLSNADKHRVPQVALIAPTNLSHKVNADFQSDADAAANTPPDTSVLEGPLEPGAVLLEWRTNRPVVGVRGQFDSGAIVALQMPGELAPLADTLQELHRCTASVASQFYRFFK